ncbi:hypothetical protein [Cellulomonas soli]|uniref:Transporter n=1 Tax=Cellulomonas soli TaxID=931535 RepID=A0A512PG06_9CELL|nr:hypothetical protein [Cellulomonas soli]NYI59776.1 ABC-2 type transport system permease protein [Cellulomonas soli]GEP70082.1 hypothetical protein CSO01_27970 [Cellulomonas soli]
MVAHLVRLKLALLRNGLRRSPWQVVGLVIGAFYGLGALAVVVAASAALSVQDVGLQREVTVLLGGVLVLGWWVVPLVAFGVDATLDPLRFVTFAIPRRRLVAGLAVAALVGLPGLFTVLAVLALAGVWWRTPAALAAAVPCAVLTVALCVVGSRATTTLLARVVGRRRVRELAAVVAVLPLVLLGPLMSRLGEGVAATATGALERVADVVAWTPMGALWAVPADVAAGAPGAAVLRLLLGLVSLLVLAVAWDRALGYALVHPARDASATHKHGVGMFGRVPGTPFGAVVARCLTYWVRDPRYAASVATVPLVVLMLWLVGVEGQALLLAGPLVAFLMGWSISADVAFDGTAFWTHVAAPLPGRVDRAGRAVAALVVAGPVALVAAVASALLTGRPEALPAVLGATVGVLLTALGGSSVVSALVVYPVQEPGQNPFTTRQGTSLAAFTSQMVGWSAVALLSSPVIVLGVLAVARDMPALGWVALVLGPALGAALLVTGVQVGGRSLDRTAPGLLARLRSFA